MTVLGPFGYMAKVRALGDTELCIYCFGEGKEIILQAPAARAWEPPRFGTHRVSQSTETLSHHWGGGLDALPLRAYYAVPHVLQLPNSCNLRCSSELPCKVVKQDLEMPSLRK